MANFNVSAAAANGPAGSVVFFGQLNNADTISLPGPHTTAGFVVFLSMTALGNPDDNDYSDNSWSGARAGATPLGDNRGWTIATNEADSFTGGFANCRPHGVSAQVLVIKNPAT